MKIKQVFDKIRGEIALLAGLFIISIISLKFIFFKEDFITIIRLVFSFFFVFIIPGFAAMLYWKNKLNFSERLVIGTGLSAALTGIASYYIGIIGLDIKYHGYLIPSAVIIAGFAIYYKKFIS
ncbi:hypothetical protein GF323_04430 [Candidatus Woesearchaeota archaeon]|nr:hypothetical protein [Candidatus Woesearchaeota archaeon]